MDLSSVIIAVAGVAGTLGGALLTQRGSQRAKRLEIEGTRAGLGCAGCRGFPWCPGLGAGRGG
ncbi:hypothetical protein B5180_11260 [Streptomyces sp. BF-3]|nr:hypothetical protein B5180_11260 [Streptomyces sp. BF-3]